MTDDRPTPSRRAVLGRAGAGLLVAAPLAAETEAGGLDRPEASSDDPASYRETRHVRAFYARARF